MPSPLSLPFNKEAEISVLGQILVNPAEASLVVFPLLDSEDFYIPRHGHIYRAMLRLNELNKEIDVVQIGDQLRSEGKFDLVGGNSALAALYENTPAVASIAQHARIVREKSTLRSMIREMAQISTEARADPDDIPSFLDKAEQQIFDISRRDASLDVHPIKNLVDSVVKSITDRKGVKVTGVSTGYHDLDRLTAGLQPSELTIIAARPSLGKTALSLNIAQNVMMSGDPAPVLFFSLEMSKETLVERLISSIAEIDLHGIRRGTWDEEDFLRLTRAAGKLKKALLWVDDTPAPTILEIRAKARRFRADRSIFRDDNKGLGLVIVDYLQLARGHRRFESREVEVAEISRGLKVLAKEINLPIIALSQLRRAAEDRKDGRPQLSDLRESGAIEQDADLILFIHRPFVEGTSTRDNMTELIVGKNRNGPVETVDLTFRGKFTRFDSVFKGQQMGPS